jgi:hypothetical protein
MATLKFDIKGFSELQAKIKALPKELQEEVVGEIQAWGYEVNAEQITLIGQQKIQDQGALQQNTKANKLPDGIDLISNVYYAPYIEFGTGPKVKVPAELNNYASQFRGKKRGDFRTFVKAMEAWLRRKKGNPKLAFIAALNIIRNGQEARPYFFPPYLRKRKELINRLNVVIGKAL